MLLAPRTTKGTVSGGSAGRLRASCAATRSTAPSSRRFGIAKTSPRADQLVSLYGALTSMRDAFAATLPA